MSEAVYAPHHPVALALSALISATQNGRSVFLADLEEVALHRGVMIGGPSFDHAAAMAGLPYSPSMDAYIDADTWAAVELPVPHWRVPPEVVTEVRAFLA